VSQHINIEKYSLKLILTGTIHFIGRNKMLRNSLERVKGRSTSTSIALIYALHASISHQYLLMLSLSQRVQRNRNSDLSQKILKIPTFVLLQCTRT